MQQNVLPWMPTLDDLVEHSIALLREHEPVGGYYGCFSGGKDSIVIKELARMAGVDVTWHYNITTIDPPELFRFIKREHPDVVRVPPRHGAFFRQMERRGFPTRRGAWCCEKLKEEGAPRGSTLILGVRADESTARAARWSEVHHDERFGTTKILPAFTWAADEIWTFIRGQDLVYCGLYDEGWHRLGCVGCPKARPRHRRRELARWPAYERRWMLAFERLWTTRPATWGIRQRFSGWEDLWNWWLSDRPLPPPRDGGPHGQSVLF